MTTNDLTMGLTLTCALITIHCGAISLGPRTFQEMQASRDERRIWPRTGAKRADPAF